MKERDKVEDEDCVSTAWRHCRQLSTIDEENEGRSYSSTRGFPCYDSLVDLHRALQDALREAEGRETAISAEEGGRGENTQAPQIPLSLIHTGRLSFRPDLGCEDEWAVPSASVAKTVFDESGSERRKRQFKYRLFPREKTKVMAGSSARVDKGKQAVCNMNKEVEKGDEAMEWVRGFEGRDTWASAVDDLRAYFAANQFFEGRMEVCKEESEISDGDQSQRRRDRKPLPAKPSAEEKQTVFMRGGAGDEQEIWAYGHDDFEMDDMAWDSIRDSASSVSSYELAMRIHREEATGEDHFTVQSGSLNFEAEKERLEGRVRTDNGVAQQRVLVPTRNAGRESVRISDFPSPPESPVTSKPLPPRPSYEQYGSPTRSSFSTRSASTVRPHKDSLPSPRRQLDTTPRREEDDGSGSCTDSQPSSPRTIRGVGLNPQWELGHPPRVPAVLQPGFQTPKGKGRALIPHGVDDRSDGQNSSVVSGSSVSAASSGSRQWNRHGFRDYRPGDEPTTPQRYPTVRKLRGGERHDLTGEPLDQSLQQQRHSGAYSDVRSFRHGDNNVGGPNPMGDPNEHSIRGGTQQTFSQGIDLPEPDIGESWSQVGEAERKRRTVQLLQRMEEEPEDPQVLQLKEHIEKEFKARAGREYNLYKSTMMAIEKDLTLSDAEKGVKRMMEHARLETQLRRDRIDTMYDKIDRMRRTSFMHELEEDWQRNKIAQNILAPAQVPQPSQVAKTERSTFKLVGKTIGRILRWTLAIPDDPALKSYSRRFPPVEKEPALLPFPGMALTTPLSPQPRASEAVNVHSSRGTTPVSGRSKSKRKESSEGLRRLRSAQSGSSRGPPHGTEISGTTMKTSPQVYSPQVEIGSSSDVSTQFPTQSVVYGPSSLAGLSGINGVEERRPGANTALGRGGSGARIQGEPRSFNNRAPAHGGDYPQLRGLEQTTSIETHSPQRLASNSSKGPLAPTASRRGRQAPERLAPSRQDPWEEASSSRPREATTRNVRSEASDMTTTTNATTWPNLYEREMDERRR